MLLRFSHIFPVFAVAMIVLAGCKGSSTGPGNTTTNMNIGDTIPRKLSNYSYFISQLDQSDSIILGSQLTDNGVLVDSTGLTIFGKSNAYFIFDNGDTTYYAYEANSDVSMYLENPGYYFIYRPPAGIAPQDETLQVIENIVFHNWITLPIASKKTGVTIVNGQYPITVSGAPGNANILATVDFINDSSITIQNGGILAAEHCRISITANITFGTYPLTLTHVRNLWFVPKIGYIARQTTRTNMPAYSVLIIARDTTATLKTLTSYQLK
jgi:hypothetical protein